MDTKTKIHDKEVVYLQPALPPEYEEDEIDFLEHWQVIWNGKWIIFSVTTFAVILAIILAFFVLPVTYKSEAVLAPVTTDNSVGGLSSLVASLPIPISIPGSSTSNTRILDFLQSRALQERLITQYNLLPIMYEKLWDADNKKWIVDDPDDMPTIIKTLQEKALDDFYEASQDKKTNLITISWIGKDPELCSTMLFAVIKELNHFLKTEYVSSARKEREFIEKQLSSATTELEYWEKQVPSETLTLEKITREHLASQTVYTELRKQLELAKIAEAKEMIRFKVLDKPFVPEVKYKPKRKLIVALAGVTGGFLGVFLVFVLNFIRKGKGEATPEATN